MTKEERNDLVYHLYNSLGKECADEVLEVVGKEYQRGRNEAKTKAIYLKYGRAYGEALAPEVFYTQAEAERSIAEDIASDVVDDFRDELEEAGVNINDAQAVIDWGSARDYCTDNCYMYSSDWHELNCVKEIIEM